MKILQENPPILEKIISAGMNPNALTIFTIGDTIYNPSGTFIPDHMLEHEKTHSKQQGADSDGWWGRYLTDQYFRISQESEAYARQYAFICRTQKDRNARTRILVDLAGFLSGPIYGSVIKHSDAMKMIKNKANIK